MFAFIFTRQTLAATINVGNGVLFHGCKKPVDQISPDFEEHGALITIECCDVRFQLSNRAWAIHINHILQLTP